MELGEFIEEARRRFKVPADMTATPDLAFMWSIGSKTKTERNARKLLLRLINEDDLPSVSVLLSLLAHPFNCTFNECFELPENRKVKKSALAALERVLVLGGERADMLCSYIEIVDKKAGAAARQLTKRTGAG